MTLLHRRVQRQVTASVGALRQRLQGPAAAEGDGGEAADAAGSAAGSAAVNGQLDGHGIVGAGGSDALAAGSQLGAALPPLHTGAASPGVGSPRLSTASPTSPRAALSPGGSRGGQRGGGGLQQGGRSGAELLRAHGTLKLSLPGHDLTATLGYHQVRAWAWGPWLIKQ